MTAHVAVRHKRRLALAGLSAVALAPFARAAVGAADGAADGTAKEPPTRVVVLDWPLTEVVLSLGVVPVGVSRPSWYAKLDGVPALPPQVVDTGLLYQPNFEVLAALQPELIVITPWHAPLRALLERIAPTLTVQLFGPGIDVYPAVRDATRTLAAALGRDAAADALFAQAAANLVAASGRLADFRATRRPVYLLRPIDDRHIAVFGNNSLFGGVLGALGIRNAWQGIADPQGMTEADLGALAQQADAQVVTIGLPPGVAAQLARSPLWNALPFVSQNRVRNIGPLPALGGMVASMRFADSLATALQGVTQ
ncbi:ABC transporter substrate-binding protein [Paraburkholderia phenoliruptrix]|uniref:ABC transporter substrate-binding protein n=1 Tax=Paraburkholderia phenoliruptrix TaxID=252970 RepID=A0ABV3WJ46_9BURK|nr:ABC transporter substrate-binding protein [Paraburkholderia phenoliruptrix]MDR6392389.1 iron complex transport system substrate-binding protein [Paraburkholderia phenoliruptrix]